MLRTCSITLFVFLVISCGGGNNNNNNSNNNNNITNDSRYNYPLSLTFRDCTSNDNYLVISEYNYVHVRDTGILNPDLNSFQCSNHENFARDKDNLYIHLQAYPINNSSVIQALNFIYASDGNVIFGVRDADVASFEIIDPSRADNHTRDRNNIYYNGAVQNVDYNSYEVIAKDLARDNAQFIHLGSQYFPFSDAKYAGLDVANFNNIGGKYFISPDNQAYYYSMFILDLKPVVINNADGQSFRHIEGDFARDNNSYYWKGRPFSDANLRLTLLGGHFSFDGVNYYAGSRMLENVDVASFQVNQKYFFAYDQNAIYGFENSGSFQMLGNTNNLRVLRGGYIITDEIVTDLRLNFTDTGPAQYLGGNYLKTNTYVYYAGRRITNALPNSFSFLGLYSNNPITQSVDPLAKDSSTYYLRNRAFTIAGSDPSSFTLLSPYYAKDNNNIYNSFTIVNGALVNSFQPLGRLHGKDNISAFFQNSAITGAISASFVSLNTLYSRDENSYFYRWSSFGSYSEGSTFQQLDGNYSVIDNAQVYNRETLLPTALGAEFQTLAFNFGMDNDEVFYLTTSLAGMTPRNTRIAANDSIIYDNDTVYYRDILVNGISDTSNFRVYFYDSFGSPQVSDYFTDGNNVYYRNLLVNGASPNSFVAVTNASGYDSVNMNMFVGEVLQ